MDPVILGVIVVIIITAALVSFILTFQKKGGTTSNVQQEYIKGLNAMIAGKYDKALDHLKRTVQRNTEYLDAYIKIGDILRKQNKPENAIKVHRDLLVRPNLTKDQRICILTALAKNYRADEQYQQASTACDHILEIDKSNEWAVTFKLKLLQDIKDWIGAFEWVKKSKKIISIEHNQLAGFKTKQGIQHLPAKEHEARLCFREAIKLDKKFVPAYLELIDSYFREQRTKDAFSELKVFFKNCPNQTHLVFSRLKNVLFELGQFSDLEKVYKDLLKSNPNTLDAYLGLSELFEKKGEILNAIKMCEKAVAQNNNRLDIKLKLVSLYDKVDQHQKASTLAAEMAKSLSETHIDFICQKCGHVEQDYFWHCTSCQAWNSAERKS